MNNLVEANDCFVKALAICQNIFGEKNISTAETYRQIADLYCKQNHEKAFFYYDKAQSIYEFLYGPDNINTVIIFNNLAGMYEKMGLIEKAEQMCLNSLRVKNRINGPSNEDLDIAKILNNLANINVHKSNMEEALRLIQ